MSAIQNRFKNRFKNKVPASNQKPIHASKLLKAMIPLAMLSLISFGMGGCTTLASNKKPSADASDSQAPTQYFNCSNPTGCLPITTQTPIDTVTAANYPIVLVHGLGGFTSLFGRLNYFNGIPEALMAGGSQVYVTKTSAIHNAEFRGEQLLQQIATITALTGKDKVNLIGHSLGGIDIRYAAATHPEVVASVTAVASPEQGSKMSDWVYSTITQSSAKSGYEEGAFNKRSQAVIAFFQLFGGFMDKASGIAPDARQEQNALKATIGLTTHYMTTYFNPKYPAAMPSHYCGQPPKNYVVNGIPYYSFSGVGTLTNKLDSSDYLLKLTAKSFGEDDANDGLVSACSSRLGYVIRDNYRMNHLDSVNQILGMVAANETNPLVIYRNQVNRLKEQGL